MNIAIIPARGGSQRIPRKNIREFHGKPIIAYSIEFAKRTGLFDEIVVSTDDGQISRIAGACGAGHVIMRRPGLEDAGTNEVAADALKVMGASDGLACVIYATAPMIDEQEFYRGMRCLQQPEAAFAFSVFDDGNAFEDAGQWYWGNVSDFLSGTPIDWNSDRVWKVLVPKETACDINVEEDWQRAEQMYLKLKEEGRV